MMTKNSSSSKSYSFHLKKEIPKPRRVVITGLGVVSPFGNSVEKLWTDLNNMKCAIKSLPITNNTGGSTLSDAQQQIWSKISNPIGGYISQSELDQSMDQCLAFTELTNRDKSITKSRLSKFIQFAMVSAHQALVDSGLDIKSIKDRSSIGVSMGSSLGAAAEIGEAFTMVENLKPTKVSPVFYPRILNNMASGYIAMQHDLQGPMVSCSTACATGAHSIGEAFQFIKYGHGKVMIAGGCENSFEPIYYVGFGRARALSGITDPQTSSRPFDKSRDGFVMSEGAGCLVLEELDHALERGARIYAELVGYGTAADAYHPTTPSPDGRAAILAMRSAINDSIVDVKLSEIDHVNCHATSTPAGDRVELQAIQSLFSESGQNVYVNSMKGALGHMLGAAGAVESIGTVLSVYNNQIPATLNFDKLDDDLTELEQSNIKIVSGKSQKTTVRAALCNSFGFGGTNCSLLFAKYDQ